MADIYLDQQIINYLQSRKSCKTVDIARDLKIEKKALNSQLYKMQSYGSVMKVHDIPPMWKSINRNNEFPLPVNKIWSNSRQTKRAHPANNFPSKRKHRTKDCSLYQNKTVNTEALPQVLEFLKNKSTPVKTRELATAVGLNTSGQINPTLYHMEKNNLIVRASIEPTTWTINMLHHPGDLSCCPNDTEPESMETELDSVEKRTVPFVKMDEDLSHVERPTVQFFSTCTIKKEEEDTEFRGGWDKGENEDGFMNNDYEKKVEIENFSDRTYTSNVDTQNHQEFSEEDLSHDVDQSSSTSEKHSDNYDFAATSSIDTGHHTDEVLKCLLTCPMCSATEFILKNKSGLSESKLAAALLELKSKKYIAEQKPLWVLTPTGESYVESRKDFFVGSNFSNINSEPVPRPKKATHSGRPLLPHELIARETNLRPVVSSATSESKTINPRSSTAASTGHARPPPSVSQSLCSSQSDLLSSDSKPKPLMSLSVAPSNELYLPVSDKRLNRSPLMGLLATVSSQYDTSKNIVKESFVPSSDFPASTNSYGFERHSLNSGRSLMSFSKINDTSRTQDSRASSERKPFSVPSSKPTCTTSEFKVQFGMGAPYSMGSTGIANASSGKAEFRMPFSPAGLLGMQTNRNSSCMSESRTVESAINKNSSQHSVAEPSLLQSSRMYCEQRPPSQRSSNVATSQSSFKPPLPPLSLIQHQLKLTEISPSHKISITTAQSKSNMTLTMTQSGQPVKSNSLIGHKTSSEHRLLTEPRAINMTEIAGLAPANISISTESFAALNKNAVSALMEYAQSRHNDARIEVISQRGPSHKPKFEIAAFVGSRQFPSIICSNKKDGRKEAADIALRSLIAEGQYNEEKNSTVAKVPTSNMTHFDKMAALTHQKFNVLIASIPESFAGRKVIAGLVMKMSDDDIGTVISIGTGNRCITGQQMSLEGCTVNDCHAEIITRRGFIRFLYQQLKKFDPDKPNYLFEMLPSGKLALKDGITFHLYISTAPCGDGALFSPRDAGSNNTPQSNWSERHHHPTFTNSAQGLLRTKMEGGEGTIPVEPGPNIQTFDGIQRGERLRTMSCTDKICRWNILGMQGALLSHFLEPIYMDSLTLGLLYDHGHLARAVCCRLGRGLDHIDTQIPPSYTLNHPWLGRVTACDPPREVQKTKSLSINWTWGDERPEVLDGSKGLMYTGIEKGFFSRCTKRNFFNSFKEVCQKFGKQDLLAASSYSECKQMATDFVQAKNALLQKLKEEKYGTWVSKPIEEEMFT